MHLMHCTYAQSFGTLTFAPQHQQSKSKMVISTSTGLIIMLSVLADIFIEICGGKIQNTYRNVCQTRAALFGLSTLICLFTYEVLSKVMDLIGGTGVMLTSFILPIACYIKLSKVEGWALLGNQVLLFICSLLTVIVAIEPLVLR